MEYILMLLILKKKNSFTKNQNFRAIISIAEACHGEFMLLIKSQIIQIDRHPLYPCSIIDIIRNYIKN